MGSWRMYSFLYFGLALTLPLSFTNVCSIIFLFFSYFTSTFFAVLIQTQICARTNAHRHNMHTIPIYVGSVSRLDWYLFCVLFPCHTITYTIHTCERSASFEPVRGYVFVKKTSYAEGIKSNKCTFRRIMNCVNSGKCWSATYCWDLSTSFSLFPFPFALSFPPCTDKSFQLIQKNE